MAVNLIAFFSHKDTNIEIKNPIKDNPNPTKNGLKFEVYSIIRGVIS